MEDLISRQAAIDAASEGCFELRGVFARIEEKLKALPSAQPEPKWIPCSERLPKARTEVVVSYTDDSGDRRYTSSGWLNKEYWIVDYEINNFVVAWMPLPEPYREEGEQE